MIGLQIFMMEIFLFGQGAKYETQSSILKVSKFIIIVRDESVVCHIAEHR
jgi:hypothetical protein